MIHRQSRIQAVVDFVDVEIETLKSTNFQKVQKAFAKALNTPFGTNFHVIAILPNKGGGTRHFSVRIHDVKTYSEIEQKLIKVGSKLALKPGFRIAKIELAIDAYCKDPADQAARFYKFMANPVNANRRMYREKRDLKPFAVPRQLDSIKRHLSEGWQIGVGNKTDERYQHIYLKDSDTINGQREEVEKRARIEIRLSGVALPYQTSEEWKQCRFERLADYFRQRELKADLAPPIQTLAEAADQIGERKTRNRREGGTRKYSKATKAAPINEAIRDALRKLSARWKGTGKRGRPAKIGTKSACEFSGGINRQNPHEHREEPINSNNYIYDNNKNTDNIINQKQHNQANNGRKCDASSESAKPIPIEPTDGALHNLMRLYKATPEAKIEHERIDAIMGACVGDADPSPLNRSLRKIDAQRWDTVFQSGQIFEESYTLAITGAVSAAYAGVAYSVVSSGATLGFGLG